MFNEINWEDCYTTGNTPWDRDKPDGQLLKLIEEYKIPPSSVLDVGCGTGVTGRALARRGFKVKGIDISPTAIESAKNHNTTAEFEVVDFLKTKLDSTFDFVIDTGCFHYTLDRNFVKRVSNHLGETGLWYTTIGSNEEKKVLPVPFGPPVHSLEEIIDTVKLHFVVNDIRHYMFSDTGFYFYSVLLTKRP